MTSKLPYRQMPVKQYAVQALPIRQGRPNNSPMEIGQVIRVLRIQRGLTQEELALEAQVATSNVSRIENGQRQPSQDLLKRLARALRTPVSRIYTMSEEGLVSAERIEPNLDRYLACDLAFADSMEAISPEFSLDLEEHAETALTPEVMALLKYFQQLTPENKALALEHIKLLNRMQKSE